MGDVWHELNDVIDEIRNIRDIRAFAIIRRDGVVVLHDLGADGDPKQMAAISAAILGTAEFATQRMRQGKILWAMVECEAGRILLTGAGEQTLLASLIYPDSNLGLVLIELEKVAKKVAKVLDGATGGLEECVSPGTTH